MIETAAHAIAGEPVQTWKDAARPAVMAVLPLILEACAKIADDEGYDEYANIHIAENIRALIPASSACAASE